MHLLRRRAGKILSRSSCLLATFLLMGILHSNIASALPAPQDDGIDTSIDDPEWNDDTAGGGGDPFSLDPSTLEDKYPDLDECRSKCSVAADVSLFYSKVGPHEEKPQDFADKEGLKLVRDTYPSGFTDKNDQYSGYKKFATRFSQAFAEKTAGTAYVMLPTDGTTDIGKSVWRKTERGTLEATGGKCNRIVKVDPDDFSKKCILWDRSGTTDPNMSECNDEIGPVPDPPSGSAYASGWCGVHVTQYQKNEPKSNPTGDYKFDITIKDDSGATIGTNYGAVAQNGVGVDVTSKLPWVLVVTAQRVDDDAVLFSYSDQSWGSNDQEHHCNFGGYEDGNRDGDCGFNC
ncbi:hypothetical protein MMC07_007921 [Pseudocyphellaria aurata]|nr:hypothetical protein [Pseudocyphellaria aurata]